jgi:hypothetical protein
MPLKQKHIEELIQIHLTETGERLPGADAWAMAHRLLGVMRLLIEDDSYATRSHLRKKID